MPTAFVCPDARTLEQFLLGRLSGIEAEQLEQHVSTCSQCVHTLRSLRADDTLVQALRGVPRVLADTSDGDLVAKLRHWLKQLPAGSGQTPPPATLASSLPAAAGPSDTAREVFDFLAPAQQPGDLGRLGPYRVLRVLGAGGMGVVFLAEDPRLHRQVALKAIRPELAANEKIRQRFLREARAIAALEHDHIVAIYEVNEERGVPYLAMPLLKGETLDDRLKREPVLPVAEVLRIGREIAAGLAAAHARGLVHRDIKPSNIWLEQKNEGGRMKDESEDPSCSSFILPPSSFPRVKVFDFGLARMRDSDEPALPAGAGPAYANLSAAGGILGTPAYMAPEQAQNAAVDGRADLFSLGCVLYRMATGRLPFEGVDVLTTLVLIATAQPAPPGQVNPELPPAFADLIVRLMAKDPAERPQSAGAVVEAIAALERQREEEARPKPSRRRALLGTAVALLATVSLTATVLLNRPAVPSEEPGEVTFACDEPDLGLLIRRADEPEQTLDLRSNRTHALPPGDYALRPAVAKEGRRLLPDHLLVKPGEAQRVELRLVGEIRRNSWHSLTVWAVALSPRKGELLALSASNDRSIAVWNAAGDDRPQFLEGHESPVRCVAYSADGRFAASGSGDRGNQADLSIRLWDLGTLRPLGRLLGHESWVTAVALAPDGKRVLSGGADGAVFLWDVATQKRLRSLEGHDRLGVTGVAFSPDGHQALTCGADKLVLLWDADKGTLLRRLEGHTEAVRGVAFAPHGAEAASASGDGSLRVWDLKTGSSRVIRGHKGAVHAVAYSPDGRRLLSGGADGTVRLWDVAAGRELYCFQGHHNAVHGVAFAADGRRALSGGADRTVRLWELPN